MLAAALGKSSEDFFTAEAKKPPLIPLASRSGQPSNRSQRRPRAPLQPNQCARSRGFGHWKNEYPEGRRENKSLPVAELINIETEEGCRGSKTSGPRESMVTLKIGDQDIDFMADTGAELSVVTKPVAPVSKRTAAVTGVSGEEMVKSFCQPRKCQMGVTK